MMTREKPVRMNMQNFLYITPLSVKNIPFSKENNLFRRKLFFGKRCFLETGNGDGAQVFWEEASPQYIETLLNSAGYYFAVRNLI